MVDVTDATFEAEVLARSDELPVVVDLWAPWCGPCRTLGPILEQVIDDTEGQVVLAKVNTDENPGVSQAFDVQGIPAVHAVHKRKVVASFVGAQPERMVRDFVASLLPSEQALQIEALFEAGDEASLEAILELEPGHPRAIVALAELYVSEDRPDEALAILHKIPESAETRRVAALARTGAEDDEAANELLADVEPKLEALLGRVKEDEAARQEYLDLLELMGPMDPRTVEYRRALSRQLF
jgi:putative thioredoxin